MAVAVPVASVSDITFEGATFNELTDAFGQLVSLEASIRSVLLRVVAELSEFEDEVVSSGYTSLEEWIVVTSGRRTVHSRELLAVSSALGGLPLVGDAFARGELDWDKLVLITKVADSSSDEHFAARHGEYSLAGLRALARHAEPLSVDDLNLAQERRYARWHVRGAEVFLNARLPVDQAAGLLAGIESKLGSAGPDPVDGKFPSVGQAKADGLCAMADGITATVVIEASATVSLNSVTSLRSAVQHSNDCVATVECRWSPSKTAKHSASDAFRGTFLRGSQDASDTETKAVAFQDVKEHLGPRVITLSTGHTVARQI